MEGLPPLHLGEEIGAFLHSNDDIRESGLNLANIVGSYDNEWQQMHQSLEYSFQDDSKLIVGESNTLDDCLHNNHGLDTSTYKTNSTYVQQMQAPCVKNYSQTTHYYKPSDDQYSDLLEELNCMDFDNVGSTPKLENTVNNGSNKTTQDFTWHPSEDNFQVQENYSTYSPQYLLHPQSFPIATFPSYGSCAQSTPVTHETASSIYEIPEPTIQNVVASINLGCLLGLHDIALKARNAEYKPNRFPGVTLRIREPRTTASVFASGKVTCTGAKSVEAARLACRKYARIIQSLGYDAQFKDFRVHNIVASFSLDFRIKLKDFFISHSRFCTYEPEIFPALIYRMLLPRTVLLIFDSGKIIIVGAKTMQHIEDAFQNICPVIRQFAGDRTWTAELASGRLTAH